MWQRIQTLYLFLSTVLVGLLLFVDKSQGVSFTVYLPYLILIAIISILNILALTTWKFRIFQMRTAVLSALITLAFQAWLAVDYFVADKTTVYYLTILFPLAATVFDLLAAKNIFADELMVRNASRLRSRKKK